MKKILFFILTISLFSIAAEAQKPEYYKLPIFDRLYYLKANVDVATSGRDALEHWKDDGIKEGRASSPVFCAKYYLENNKDLADAFGLTSYTKAIDHYLSTGMKEGRRASEDFDPKYYVDNNPDLYQAFGKQYDKLVEHYLTSGYKENRRAANNDSDDDGVINSQDKCPNEAGPSSNNGCPLPKVEISKEEADAVTKELNAKAPNLQFETGLAVLTPASTQILDGLATYMASHPAVRFNVHGHTDNVGVETANHKLSEARAFAVKDYLVKKGIDRSRIVAKGYGSTKPIADNATPAGKAKNRRVEMSIIK